MWIASLHNTDFVQQVLGHVESRGVSGYGTYPRIKGMLTLAKEVGDWEEMFCTLLNRFVGTSNPILFHAPKAS
jgi:tRNA G26 N,N-dimethylase Trm1